MIMESIDTLCIVDDDSVFQFITQKVVEKTNLVRKIKVFSNGLEAIEFLKSVRENPEELPDVILLDLAMPILNGWDFLEEYVELRPSLGKQIVLFIVSSSIDPADIERARSISEVTDFIIKPVTREKFIALVEGL